jgi:hypothetical protein
VSGQLVRKEAYIMELDSSLIIRIVAGVLFVVVLGIIIMRRKQKKA